MGSPVPFPLLNLKSKGKDGGYCMRHEVKDLLEIKLKDTIPFACSGRPPFSLNRAQGGELDLCTRRETAICVV